ncbi:MAG TPA: hypothetical protein VKU00_23575 [Chthonomonadaceae bacterium]|nr:hypothetical protein [Chthonomonadaceae bacterium]
MAFAALGGLFCLVGFVCAIIILIDAFKNEIWKGIVAFLCWIYMLYYAFAEFQHEKKGLILAGWIIGGVLGGVLLNMGIAQIALSSGGTLPR